MKPVQIELPGEPFWRSRPLRLHLLRWFIFVAVVALIHSSHQARLARERASKSSGVSIERVQRFFPEAREISQPDEEHGGRYVLDERENILGYALQTSPESDFIKGYSGPTNTLVVLDADNRISGIEVLSSGDTPEHLDSVVDDDVFMRSFDGTAWDSVSEVEVDAVSGATLTSLALAEGVIHRLGGSKPSLRFPDSLGLEDAQLCFDDAETLVDAGGGAWDVNDTSGKRIGRLVRTAPFAEDIMGYRGPTDTLLALSSDGQVVRRIAVRKSYDNEEYVRDVFNDDWFMESFVSMSLQDLSVINKDEVTVEGVSGATMTSLAIVDGLQKTAQSLISPRPGGEPLIKFAARDFVTTFIVLMAIVLSLTRMRGHKHFRMAFKLILILGLGFTSGDMVSQALLAGWARSGIAWQFSPGLVVLVVVAFLFPLMSKKQVYCHQVCPYGAIQEVIKNRIPWKLRLHRRLVTLLRALPFLLLVWATVVAIAHLPYSLASIEPFDAFLYRVAGPATIAIAVSGLVFSAVVPMGYCRFGCPTGALLNFLRLGGPQARFSFVDAGAIVFLILLVVLS